MLTDQQFEIVQGYPPFRFKTLQLIERSQLFDVYEWEERELTVITTNNLNLLSKVRSLQINGFIHPLLGYLRKKLTYYIFSQLSQQEYTLKSYIERIQSNIYPKPYISDIEFDRLFKFLTKFLQMLHGDRVIYCTLLTPDMIEVQEGDAIKFHMIWPMEELLIVDRDLEKNIKKYYHENVEYAAPEIVKFCSLDNQQAIYRRNGKEAIYSVALVLLFAVFGQNFRKEQRFLALDDRRDFECQLKFKRKHIKTFYDSKIPSKSLKLLLQKDHHLRDDSQTLKIKLASRQFHQHMPKLIPSILPVNTEIERVQTIEDIEKSDSQSMKKSQVDLHLSKNASNDIMKNSKQTQPSSGIYKKNADTQERHSSNVDVEIRVTHSVQDIDMAVDHEIQETTIGGRLVRAPPPAQIFMARQEQDKRVELTEQNPDIRSSQMVLSESQYRLLPSREVNRLGCLSAAYLLAGLVTGGMLIFYTLQ